MIGDAVALAARLRHANVPPLTLIAGDAEKLRRELDARLEQAAELVQEFHDRVLKPDADPSYVDAQMWRLSTALYDIRRQITLAHCELIPPQATERRAAAFRVADYFRKRQKIEHRLLERRAA
jgi:hypothetical protein